MRLRPEPCQAPDRLLLRQFVQEELPLDERRDVESHIQVCSVCESVVEELRRASTQVHSTVVSTAPSPSPTVRASEPFPDIPGYRLEEVIGRGGMGVVYRSKDIALNREVAVKVMRDRSLTGDGLTGAIKRFVREAQITGQLQHPGIPAVHQIGRLGDDRPYLAMKMIKGQTLEQLLGEQGRAADRGRLIALFEKVCDTVAYAHSRQVIHRDLKPNNLMVGKFGEVQVMDWGLAKSLLEPDPEPVPPPQAGDTGLTEIRTTQDLDPHSADGEVLGTPAYMPPEQAGGEVEKIDARADVFALGAILCCLLTGRPPYVGNLPAVTRMAIRGDLADAFVRLDGCGWEPDLVALAKRCLAGNPADRPADAGVVARAVGDIRSNAERRAREAELKQVKEEAERIQAQARARIERMRRRRAVATACVGVLLVAIAAGALILLARQRVAQEEQTAALVNQALGQTETLRNEAVKAPIDEPAERQRASRTWDEVRAAADRAEQALDQGRASAELRVRAGQVLAEVRKDAAAADRDRLMLDHLEVARQAKARITDQDANDPEVWSRLYLYGSAGATLYAKAFLEYGIDISKLDVPAAVTRIRERERIRQHLIAALDDWYLVKPNAAQADRLLSVADASDDDGARKQIRAAIIRKDRTELLRIANGPEVDSLPPQTILLLAAGLETPKDCNDSARVMERVLGRHPGHFWLNDLAGLYYTYSDPPRLVEAVAAFQSALATRPDSMVVLTNLGNAWIATNHPERASQCLRRAIEIDPLYSLTRESYIAALLDGGDPGVEAAARDWVRTDSSSRLARCSLATALLLRGKPSEADRELNELIALGTRNGLEDVRVANLLLLFGKPQEALPYCRRYVAIAPTYGEAASILGTALFMAGQVEEAAAEFTRGIQLTPRSPVCWQSRATFYSRTHRYESAVADARRAIERAPFSSTTRSDYAMCLMAAGLTADARAAADEAIRLNPRNAYAQIQRANLLEDLGLHQEAVEGLLTAAKLRPDDPTALVALGDIHRKQKEYHSAEEAYLKALKIGPNEARHHQAIGNLYYSQNQFDKSVRYYRQAVVLAPKVAEYARDLANALRESDSSARAEAIMWYLIAVDLAPNDASIRRDLCSALTKQGLASEAIDSGFMAVRLEPSTAFSHNLLANALVSANRHDEAIAEYREAIRFMPGDHILHANLAGTYETRRRNPEAISEWQIAMHLAPQNAFYPNRLGNLYHQLGRFAEAATVYREAIRLAPKAAVYHANLARSLKELGKPEHLNEGLIAAQKSIVLNQNDLTTWQILASIYQARGDNTQAETTLKRAIELNSKNPSIYTSYGQFLYARKRYQDAAIAFESAAKCAPENPAYHWALVDCWNALNQPDKVIASLRRATDLDPKNAAYARSLGVWLRRTGRPDEALIWFDRALNLRQGWASTHWARGRALAQLGRQKEAIAAFRTAELLLANDRRTADLIEWQLLIDLGLSLRQTGQITESLVALRRAHILARKIPNPQQLQDDQQKQFASLDGEIRTAERLVELDSILAGIGTRSVTPATPGIRLELAALCQRYKDRPHAAVTFSVEAFEANPKLADDLQAGHRLTAARAGIAASAGRGDASDLLAAEKTRLRKLALGWLRDDLAVRSPADLAEWLTDPALAPVRDQTGLAELPADEQTNWKELWAGVDKKATKAKPGR